MEETDPGRYTKGGGIVFSIQVALSVGGTWCSSASSVAGIRADPVFGERTAAIVVLEGGVAGPRIPVEAYPLALDPSTVWTTY